MRSPKKQTIQGFFLNNYEGLITDLTQTFSQENSNITEVVIKKHTSWQLPPKMALHKKLRKLRIWSHLLKKSLMEKLRFLCSVERRVLFSLLSAVPFLNTC